MAKDTAQSAPRLQYQPDTLTRQIMSKKVRKLWRRAMKKIIDPEADLTDTDSFRLGDLARFAYEKNKGDIELKKTQDEAKRKKDEEQRAAEEQLARDAELDKKQNQFGPLGRLLQSSSMVEDRSSDLLRQDVQIIERKVDNMMTYLQGEQFQSQWKSNRKQNTDLIEDKSYTSSYIESDEDYIDDSIILKTPRAIKTFNTIFPRVDEQQEDLYARNKKSHAHDNNNSMKWNPVFKGPMQE